GGTPATGSVYQWGKGNTPGLQILEGETGVELTTSQSVTTRYWVRRVDPGSCGNNNATSINVSMQAVPTAPTSISGTASLCGGSGTTLVANGGSHPNGSQYEWGTGEVI